VLHGGGTPGSGVYRPAILDMMQNDVRRSRLQEAVHDTSFWNAALGARVEMYLPRIFRVLAPPTVRAEVLADRVTGRGLFPNAEAFQLWESTGVLRVEGPAGGWPVEWGQVSFGGKAEQEVLLLAHERHTLALLNDYRAGDFAKRKGLPVLDVPRWIVTLVFMKTMPMGPAWAGLRYLEDTKRTSPALLTTARAMLESLWQRGWR